MRQADLRLQNADKLFHRSPFGAFDAVNFAARVFNLVDRHAPIPLRLDIQTRLQLRSAPQER